MTDTVTITKEEYESLKRDSVILQALYANGVDNWEGYGEALEDSDDETEEEIYG